MSIANGPVQDRRLRRYWFAWAITLAVMAIWPLAMFVNANGISRGELFQEATYSYFHLIFIPLISGLAIATPNLTPLAIPTSRRTWRYLFWGVAISITAFVGVVEFREYETRNLTPYMLKNAETAIKAKKEAQDAWRNLFETENPQKPDTDLRAKHRKAVEKFEKACSRPKNPRAKRNWMPFINSLMTFAVIVILGVGLFWRIMTKFLLRAFAGERYANGWMDLISVLLALPWIPLRFYADWHGTYWQFWPNVGLDPFTGTALIAFIFCLSLLGVQALVTKPDWKGLLRLQKIASLGGIFGWVGAIIVFFLPLSRRTDILLSVESVLSNPFSQFGLCLVMLGGPPFVGIIGYQLVRDRLGVTPLTWGPVET